MVPSDNPIFVSDLIAEYAPPLPKTVNSDMYVDMIKEKAAIKAIYPGGDEVFQDDNATIHWSRISMAAVKENFKFWLHPSLQASKMADIYPIENVWSIVKTKLDSKIINNLASLKQQIRIVWQEIRP